MALAEGEAALDSGAAFALLDPREFGYFYKDLETSWWQHLALGLSEAQRDSPACINTGGSTDISLTSGHGCHSRNASSSHREGLQINQTKSVPVVPGLCSPVPHSGDGWPCPLQLPDTQLAPIPD